MNHPDVRGAAPLGLSTMLLIRLRLRRLSNLMRAASLRKNKGAAAAGKRTGNPGKQGSSVVL